MIDYMNVEHYYYSTVHRVILDLQVREKNLIEIDADADNHALDRFVDHHLRNHWN